MSAHRRVAWNRTPGEPKPPAPVKLDALDERSIAERIEEFQARVFCTAYTMKRGGRAEESTT